MGFWYGSATPTSASSTAGAMDSQILSLINRDHASLGLQGLRLDSRGEAISSRIPPRPGTTMSTSA